MANMRELEQNLDEAVCDLIAEEPQMNIRSGGRCCVCHCWPGHARGCRWVALVEAFNAYDIGKMENDAPDPLLPSSSIPVTLTATVGGRVEQLPIDEAYQAVDDDLLGDVGPYTGV